MAATRQESYIKECTKGHNQVVVCVQESDLIIFLSKHEEYLKWTLTKIISHSKSKIRFYRIKEIQNFQQIVHMREVKNSSAGMTKIIPRRWDAEKIEVFHLIHSKQKLSKGKDYFFSLD